MTAVGVIGARRERQGIGSFVIRDLLAADAEVPCFLSTSPETLERTRAELRERWGIEPRGYLDVGAMLAKERLDALAICSPAETHEHHLEVALAARLHVLCEKPLVWGRPRLAATARRLAGGFLSRGLVLWENCQWPYTLPFFEALHTGSLDGVPGRFEMRLQPGSRGAQMLGDCMPHALSLLQALAPDPRPSLEDLRFSACDAESQRIEVAFRYRTSFGDTQVAVRLEQAERLPRQAELAIDGHLARRVVAPEDYRLSFAADDRFVPLADPLGLLVADFVREVRERGSISAARSREIVVRMQLLETIAAAHARALGMAE